VFWGWREVVLRRSEKADKIAGALVHWAKGSMARAFQRWKEWALYKVRISRFCGV
jgi:hypothetical protein